MALDLIPGAQGAAEYLGISRNQVYHLVNKGHLPVIKKGRSLYFRKSALEAAFDAEAQ
jgi:excisionase family DNA binding protein